MQAKHLFTGLVMTVTIIYSFSCKKSDDNLVYNSVVYQESQEDFPNPERGFFRYTQSTVDNFSPLPLNLLKQWRGLQPADGGNYSFYTSLVFRYYILEGYAGTGLPTAFLQQIDADAAAAREAGVKLILRFAYTVTTHAGACPEGFTCPPYGDAPKNIVLQHIAQMKPYFRRNADVIACMQMGFIGIWGELYFTDHFGDLSSNSIGKLLDNNWQDRSAVLAALLDALPPDRMVQVRVPQLKQRYVYGVQAPVNVSALTATEAYTGTEKARIGFHNDCFLSGIDDYGTYTDFGNSSSPRQSANSVLRSFSEADTKFVVVGGETCDDTYSPYNDCENAGKAQTEMRNYHFSYLNSAYNNTVNDDWQTGGCMGAIRKNLGYRFVLREGFFPSKAAPGEPFYISIALENLGYAALYNPRPVKLVLRNKADKKEFTADINTDPRTWYSGKISIEKTVVLPSSITPGEYELLLWLPDAYESIANRVEYAIRLANKDVWENNTGFNKLNATVVIQ